MPTYAEKIKTEPFYSRRPSLSNEKFLGSMETKQKSVKLSNKFTIVPGSWDEKERLTQSSKSYKYHECSLKLAVATSLKDILILHNKKIKPERDNEIRSKQTSDQSVNESITGIINIPTTPLPESSISPIRK